MSLTGRDRLRNIHNKKKHVKACKTLLDMQICGGVVVVFIMLSQVP